MAENEVHIPKRLAVSAAVSANPTKVSAMVITAGSDAASVVLTNDATGSGDPVLTIKAPTAVGTNAAMFPKGLNFSTACYATITGTTPEITVVYSDN